MEYYINVNGTSQGPYTGEEIQNMINSFQLNRETMIWCVAYGDWKRLGDTEFMARTSELFTPGRWGDSNSTFLYFIKPYLNYIDRGDFFRKPFSWLYGGIAIIQFLIPIVIFIGAVRMDVFKFDGMTVFGFLILWIIFAIAGWLSFQLWWDRKDKITFSSGENDEFVATPVVAHLVQTFGEWLGSYVAVVGFFFAIITAFFSSSGGYYSLNHFFSLPFSSGVMGIILSPLIGFLIIVLSKFFAEQLNAFSAIANNTGNFTRKNDNG